MFFIKVESPLKWVTFFFIDKKNHLLFSYYIEINFRVTWYLTFTSIKCLGLSEMKSKRVSIFFNKIIT